MQKKYIKIENKGIIDPQAFILLGGSTKRSDGTKIGFFGSGLKYSIAYLLRNNIDFKVFAEYKEIKFNVESIAFREQNFGVISIDGQKTSMTTEMGLDWEPWFVLREIYCNAIDEGESKISIVSEKKCVPVEDKTVFYIEVNKEFDEIMNNWSNYFSDTRKDICFIDENENKLFSGGGNFLVYRKGIRCNFAENIKSIFNYDLQWIEINESRIIKNEWDFKYKLVKYLKSIKDKKIISQILNTINLNWERDLNWVYHNENFTDEWVEVIGDKILVPYENAGFWEEYIQDAPHLYLILPQALIEGLKSRFVDRVMVIGDVDGLKGNGEFKIIDSLSKRQKFLLDECLTFLKDCDYDLKYPIKIVDFTQKNRLGQAKDETILLSVKLFDMGKKELVGCIMEEQEHLITGFGDETRAFQNHWIQKLVTSLEDKIGRYL